MIFRKIQKINFLLFLLPVVILIAAGCFLLYSKETDKNYFFSYSPATKNIRILFLGDLMFDRGIRQFAEKNGNDFIFQKIHGFLLKHDLAVANLEGPITDNQSISVNSAVGSTNNYFFTFPKSLAKTLFDENIKLVNLGNNHISNFGQEGLISTEKYLKKSGIDYFGQDSQSFIKEIGGVKIAFVGYNQFAFEGAEPLAVEEIKNAKKLSDIVVLYAHWGEEYYKNPPEYVVESAHKFIDGGADLIIGSHPHVIQNSETYNGKKIYYSLGNFVFDQYFSQETRKGMGVILKIEPDTKQMDFEESKFYLNSNGQTILTE